MDGVFCAIGAGSGARSDKQCDEELENRAIRRVLLAGLQRWCLDVSAWGDLSSHQVSCTRHLLRVSVSVPLVKGRAAASNRRRPGPALFACLRTEGYAEMLYTRVLRDFISRNLSVGRFNVPGYQSHVPLLPIKWPYRGYRPLFARFTPTLVVALCNCTTLTSRLRMVVLVLDLLWSWG